MQERGRNERMSARELREEFAYLHRKLDRVLKALERNGASVTDKGVTSTPTGELIHLKGTGPIGPSERSEVARAAERMLDARDNTEGDNTDAELHGH